MRALDTITAMLEDCGSGMASLPSTVLYNEGWMLRLLLKWFSQRPSPGHPLDFTERSRWYSEALIPSVFKPRKRGEKFAESWTHVDGVIGHFEIGKERETDLTLLTNATILKVLEAKMRSKLSQGIKHATYYNQAARSIACIAEILSRANKSPTSMISIAFYVIAPQSQIKRQYFSVELQKGSIRSVVEKRVDEYDAEHKTNKIEWFQTWFVPTLEKADIQVISWEDILSHVRNVDTDVGNDLEIFYKKCLDFNKIKNSNIVANGQIPH